MLSLHSSCLAAFPLLVAGCLLCSAVTAEPHRRLAAHAQAGRSGLDDGWEGSKNDWAAETTGIAARYSSTTGASRRMLGQKSPKSPKPLKSPSPPKVKPVKPPKASSPPKAPKAPKVKPPKVPSPPKASKSPKAASPPKSSKSPSPPFGPIGGLSSGTPPPGGPSGGNSGGTGAVFDITSYGAVAGGGSDSSRAILAAFNDACAAAMNGGERTTLLVPGGVFLTLPVRLAGIKGSSCGSAGVTIQIDGTLVAPSDPASYPSFTVNVPSVIELDYLDNLIVQGSGAIDGAGQQWWAKGGTRPSLVYLHHTNNAVIQGITLMNSPFFHLQINHCQNVLVQQFTTSSPGTSKNTDGIHMSQVSGVTVDNCTLDAGDDNISIFDGSSNIVITQITASSGHGISIGALGSGKSNTPNSCVNNVTVQGVTLSNTLTAIRIKTIQGGTGAAVNCAYSDISFSNVRYPLVLDQFYCGGSLLCQAPAQTSNVAISRISFTNIQGTATSGEGLVFRCSDTLPCTDIALSNVAISASSGGSLSPVISNVFGTTSGIISPSLSLASGSPSQSQQSLISQQISGCGF